MFRDVLHVLKRIVDFPIKELTRTHQKTIFILEIRDVSHPFPLSNLIISRNVQFPDRETTILNDSCPSFKMYMFQGSHQDSGVIHELLMGDSEVMNKL